MDSVLKLVNGGYVFIRRNGDNAAIAVASDTGADLSVILTREEARQVWARLGELLCALPWAVK